MSGFDRDAAREVLRHLPEYGEEAEGEDSALDALEACVRPAQSLGVDRRELINELMMRAPSAGATAIEFQQQADRILALLWTVDGIVLTREEADLVVGWAITEREHLGLTEAETALAERLEGGS